MGKRKRGEALGRLKVDGPQVATGPDLSPDVAHPAIARRQLGLRSGWRWKEQSARLIVREARR